jgi:hypothetical protein
MDPVLASRYMALFSSYEAGERGGAGFVKRQLISRSALTFLRPDAALLLLVLYDQMILRPYAGEIMLPSGEAMPLPPNAGDPVKTADSVSRGLDEIFKDLEQARERPISSHRVLEAIMNTWPKISELHGWG